MGPVRAADPEFPAVLLVNPAWLWSVWDAASRSPAAWKEPFKWEKVLERREMHGEAS